VQSTGWVAVVAGPRWRDASPVQSRRPAGL